MKKLLFSEGAMILMVLVTVGLGNLFGWSKDTVTFITIAAAATTVLVAVATMNVTGLVVAATAVAATLVTTIFLSMATATSNHVLDIGMATVAIVITSWLVVLVVSLVLKTKLKYCWVLLSLMVEGVVIWAILKYL